MNTVTNSHISFTQLDLNMETVWLFLWKIDLNMLECGWDVLK